jgi:hypothetical protein
MKRFFLLAALMGQSAISATSQIPRWTVMPYLGVRNVTWATGLPSLPQPYSPSPITQESGVLPNVGLHFQYLLSENYTINLRGDFHIGSSKLDGEYATFVGVEQPTISSVAGQKVKWLGWSTEGLIQRTLSLSDKVSISPQLSLLYTEWSQLPPSVDNPMVVVYQSKFNWLRSGVGAEISLNMGEKQRLYFSPSLRIPVLFRHRASNFRTSDNFTSIRDDIAERGSPEPVGLSRAESIIVSLWPQEGSVGKPNGKLGYVAEIGWESKWTVISITIENVNTERLVWYPYANATGTFTTLRVGVPIRFQERRKAQPGYFMPSSTPR